MACWDFLIPPLERAAKHDAAAVRWRERAARECWKGRGDRMLAYEENADHHEAAAELLRAKAAQSNLEK